MNVISTTYSVLKEAAILNHSTVINEASPAELPGANSLHSPSHTLQAMDGSLPEGNCTGSPPLCTGGLTG